MQPRCTNVCNTDNLATEIKKKKQNSGVKMNASRNSKSQRVNYAPNVLGVLKGMDQVKRCPLKGPQVVDPFKRGRDRVCVRIQCLLISSTLKQKLHCRMIALTMKKDLWSALHFSRNFQVLMSHFPSRKLVI